MELELEQVVIRDEDLVVFFPYDAIVEGELVVAPIHSFKDLKDFPDALIEKMFHVVNKMSSSLFDLVGCQGTNLLIQNGEVAGQKTESLFIRIIPRFENDSVKLDWSPSQPKPEDLEDVVKSLKNFDESVEQEKALRKHKEEIEKEVEPEIVSDSKKDETHENNREENKEESYLLKSLRRNP